MNTSMSPTTPTSPSPHAGPAEPPGLPAVIIRTNANDGSFSRLLHVLRDGQDSAVMEAATALLNHRLGVDHMKGRTWHVDEARVLKDPLYPDTGLKVFDRAARRSSGFMTGNVSSNVQTSTHVRAHSRVECNGRTNPPGHLRSVDLQTFGRSRFSCDVVPRQVIQALDDRPDEQTILYKVFHTMENGTPDVHGWILTAVGGEHILTVDKLRGGWARPSVASQRILEDAEAAFTMRTLEGSCRPLLRIDAGTVNLVDPRVEAALDLYKAELQPLLATSEDGDRPARPAPRG